MIKNSDIAVLIVTFNSNKTIKDCLGSILKYSPAAEIIVVDNNSSDDTCKIVERFGEKITLIKSSVNMGFARANNLGVSRTKSNYLIFLNPDTKLLQEKSLEKLQKALEDHSDFGLIGPKLISPDGKIQKSVRNLPGILGAFKEYILGVEGDYDFYLPDCQNLSEVESVAGAGFVIKRNIFNSVGKFNEKYFLYYEDLDLCRSLKNQGLKVGYLPDVEIEHVEGASGVNQQTYKLLHDSAKKYHGLLSYFLIQFIIRLGKLIHV